MNNKKNKIKAIIAIAVALAFITPVAAVANDGTIGVTSDSEITNDLENILKTSINNDISDTIEMAGDDEPIEDQVIDVEELSIVIDDSSVVLATGKTWYVGSGAGNDSTTIQGGINLANASGGDTVYVYDGLYNERIIIAKQLDLIGESRENTIINGDWDGASWKNIVYVYKYGGLSGVNISGFTVQGRQKYGIYYNAVTGGTVRDCNVTDLRYNGIYFYKATGINIINCNIYDNEDEGIYLLWSPYTSIIDCDVYNNGEDGIYLYQACDHTQITNCNVYNNYWSGIHIRTSLDVTITDCIVHNHSYPYDYGIEIDYSLDCKLYGNAMNDNACSFGVVGSSLSYFEHDIAPTNEANGRPIYWLSGIVNETYDGIDFGFLGLISCTNITVNDSDVYGILLANTTDSTISNVRSHDTADGIYLRFASDNNEIINCNIDNCGGSGINLYGSSDNKITNCNLYNPDCSAGININANSNNNIFTNCNSSGSEWGSGIYIYQSSDNAIINCEMGYNSVGITVQTGSYRTSIVDCEIYGNGVREYGIKVDGGYTVPALATTITRCDVYNNGKDGIYIYRASDNIVTDCNSYNNGFYNDEYYGFRILSSADNVLRGNKIYDNANGFGVEGSTLTHFPQDIDATNEVDGKGIYYLVGQDGDILYGSLNIGFLGLVSCTNILVMDADVTGVVMAGTTGSTLSNVNSCDSISGFYLHTSSGNNFIDCEAYSNGDYGFYLRKSSTNNEFINCEAYDNPDKGIYFAEASNDNNITNCDVYDNKYGIYFRSSINNIVTECNVYDNSNRGIYMYSYASNNLFYHNSILRNNPNVYDKYANIWDNGYPSGGNYWSDYTGVDLYHGPNQDILGPDGIGDTPRIVYGTKNDNYPLMIPFGDVDPPEITGVTLTTSDPLDTIIGWERVTCTVADLEVRDVKLVVTYPDASIVEFDMIKSGGYVRSCYYEQTLTDAGDYAYHVWADDTNGNSAESAPETFVLPENWDMNDDRVCDISDLRMVALQFGETGLAGWIREDYNNDGVCDISDLRMVALQFGDTY